MGKVKVTQEQAEKLKMIDDILKSEFISIHKLKESLTYGYEVEPQFKVGDWIVTKGTKRVGIVKKIISRSGEGWLYHDLNNFGDVFDAFRHATSEEIQQEKQRRWWRKHDRDVWELREDDILFHVKENSFYEIERILWNGNPVLKAGSREINMEVVKSNFIIICFVEDRKDIKENDK